MMENSWPAANRDQQFRSIQALRFFAALAVVVLHSCFYTSERLDDSLGIYAIGANGVRLFFVISGFVMIMSSDRLARATHGWRVFAIKRILRIVPLYWVVTSFKLATLIVAPAAVLHAQLDWAYIAKSYFFIPTRNVDGDIHPLLGVGWTLVFEMFFYGLFTIALLLRQRPVLFLAPILILLSVISLFRSDDWPIALQFWADPIVLDFLGGMLIARWVQSGTKLNPWLAGAFVVAGGIYLFVPFERFHYQSLHGSVVTTIAAAMVVWGCACLESRIGRFVGQPLMFLGAASYAIYLVHPVTAPAAPVILAKLGLILPHLSILAGVIIALIAGSLCYQWVEKLLTRLSTGAANRLNLLDAGPDALSAGQATEVPRP
ncbi:MAG: acyltransferase [Brevundimonas sp.]|uniref:acyltransferase family protein n=1 Tax=Brevundimonas sp. TaxID=1871086 RepID=UPI00273312F7|nr:acyltransferase [Brevundimonas sp.]MDP3405217.1 acyltransferase [Brevundimonas sp.]